MDAIKLDSSEAQKIARELVHEHVYANVGTMVEYILQKSIEDTDAPFSWDEIDTRPDPSDWDATRLNAYLIDEMDLAWEDVTNDPWERREPEEEEIAAARAYIAEDEDYTDLDTSDWDAGKLENWLETRLAASWEDATGEEWETEEERLDRLEDQAEEVRDYIRDNADPAEVFEWWAISDWLSNRLGEAGEVVFDAGGLSVWGRCTTGQAIYLDYAIQQIALARHAELAKYD